MKALLLVCNTFSTIYAEVQVPGGMQICKDTNNTGHIHINNSQAATRQEKLRHNDYRLKISIIYLSICIE